VDVNQLLQVGYFSSSCSVTVTTLLVIAERLNELNRYLLFFPEECPALNHEEHVLRALADTGASSTTWSTMNGQFTTDKTGIVTFLLPELNLKKQITWEFHVDD
jgi:hypothetical protein